MYFEKLESHIFSMFFFRTYS